MIIYAIINVTDGSTLRLFGDKRSAEYFVSRMGPKRYFIEEVLIDMSNANEEAKAI